MAHDLHTEEHFVPHAHSAHAHHIIPVKLLVRVFGVLVILTILTVLTSRIHLGAMNVPLALAIALTKAGLVLAFFMGLKYDLRVNTLVVSVGCVFVVVFLVFTLFDTAFRGDIGNVGVETISDIERREEALRARDPGEAGLRLSPPNTVADPAAPAGVSPANATGTAPAGTASGAAPALPTTTPADSAGVTP